MNSSLKIAIGAGALAIVAIIATVIIISTGSTGYGLCVYDVSGDVVISNSVNGTEEKAAEDTFLSKGDIINVNEGGSCTLVYRTRDNYDENYIIAEPFTQLIVTDEFSGKSDGQLYLNRGAILSSAMTKSKSNVIVRTGSASVTVKNAVMRIEYLIGDEASITKAASFAGSSEIQLYNAMGTAVDRNGLTLEEHSAEILGEGRCAVITSGNPPTFTSLNTATVLSDFSASTLRELITASNFSELCFTAAELKQAYDAALGAVEEDNEPEETTVTTTIIETTTEETTTTTAPETTAAPVTTTRPAATTPRPVTTTAAPTATAATTTAAAATTAEELYGDDDEIYGDDLIDDEGDDDSFFTTTADTEITFLTNSTNSASNYYTVTLIVNGQYSTQKVAKGGTAILPSVNIPGYILTGWSRSPYNITSDCTISAILIADPSLTVTTTPTTTTPTTTTPTTTTTPPATTTPADTEPTPTNADSE